MTQAPPPPQPGLSIAQMRDRLDWQDLNGTADALAGHSRHPNARPRIRGPRVPNG